MPALLVPPAPERRSEEWLVRLGHRSAPVAAAVPEALGSAGGTRVSPLLSARSAVVRHRLAERRARTDVERFWLSVLLSGYACYVTLPWLVSRPPRSHQEHGTSRRGLPRLNARVLRAREPSVQHVSERPRGGGGSGSCQRWIGVSSGGTCPRRRRGCDLRRRRGRALSLRDRCDSWTGDCGGSRCGGEPRVNMCVRRGGDATHTPPVPPGDIPDRARYIRGSTNQTTRNPRRHNDLAGCRIQDSLTGSESSFDYRCRGALAVH